MKRASRLHPRHWFAVGVAAVFAVSFGACAATGQGNAALPYEYAMHEARDPTVGNDLTPGAAPYQQPRDCPPPPVDENRRPWIGLWHDAAASASLCVTRSNFTEQNDGGAATWTIVDVGDLCMELEQNSNRVFMRYRVSQVPPECEQLQLCVGPKGEVCATGAVSFACYVWVRESC